MAGSRARAERRCARIALQLGAGPGSPTAAAALAARAATAAAAASSSAEGYELSAAHAYQFDVNGFFVLKGHYSPADVAEFNAAVDELQAIPVTHEEYTARGIAHPALTPAQADPQHAAWKASQEDPNPPFRVDHAICGTDKLDKIVRDPVLRTIHETLAGGVRFHI